jgi:pimeloyl-ACP methyl ester carboxylesterase
MTPATALLVGLAVALCVAAAASLIIAASIDRRYPPEGEFVAIPEGRLHIAQRGPKSGASQADIVLIHGASATLGDQLLALADTLSRRYRVLAIDRPGHGWSERPGGAGDASPTRQARLVAAALRRHGVERAIIIGHSLGASVSAALALEDPALARGLVFVAPATHPWPGGVAWHYRLAASRIWGRLFSFLVAPLIGSLVIGQSAIAVFRPQSPPHDYVRKAGAARVITPPRFRANGEDVANLKRHVTELSRRYHEITVQCVVITGDADDTVLPSIHSHGLVRDITGAKLITLRGVGHMPHHARPEVVLAAVDEIVAGIAGRTGRAAAI